MCLQCKWVGNATAAVLLVFTIIVRYLQVDTIGQPLSELLHPEDMSQAAQSLESLFATREGGAGDEGGALGDFITRMRTTLSTAVRSSSKIQYKVSLPSRTAVDCYENLHTQL